MKGSRNPPPPPSGAVPLSPTSKSTAKYTNKDGSKFITVPKMSTPVDSAQTSPTTASPPPAKTAAHPAPGTEPAQPVNRKKQKRRAKAAAKAAAEQAQDNPSANGIPSPPRTNDQQSADADLEDDEEEPSPGPDSQEQLPYLNGTAQAASGKSKKSKKKKKKNTAGQGDELPDDSQYTLDDHGHSPAPIPPPPPPQHDRPGMSREKIWNTNSQEERERIKEFWLGLSETERKSLVKVEKDAVLKKMKEQQKHTCSCTVCGRKRTAIEEELEGLYDAYYEELEQYANHPNQGEGPPMLRPRRSFGSMGGMRPRGLHSRFSNHQPSRGRIMDDLGDEEEEEAEVEDEGEGEDEGEEVYSEEELDDDMYSEEEQEPSEELHRSDYAADFFNFGNSLTVQGRDRLPILPSFLQSYPFSGTGNNAYGTSSLGGILTVADDLLKNDGKKFIEMMEQLAERRMAREEDARGQFDRGYDHANGDRYGHSHPPPPDEEEFEDDEEEYEEDDEEEYDSQDEEDTMTEEQRMEEGRRMFQIFAARMFEQRVLTAYREKVAKERQAKLLEEIEAENQQDAQRKAKKAKDAQRRKDKAAKKKEAQAEEKARKEAEKAAEEAARRAEEVRKAEEQRVKAEEKRKKKEAQRKAEEEERQRKEAERLRKIQEREENERKAREAREREKKAREEARLKEKEAREHKERKDRERREQQERERREKEARAKAEREARVAKEAKETKEGKDTKERRKKEERAAHKAATLAAAVPVPVMLPKRSAAQQPPAPPVAAVPVLPQQPTSYASPQIPVATPALPKAPTPMRTRQTSQQDGSATSSGAASNSGSMASQNPSPHPITPVHASPGPIAPPNNSGATGTGLQSSAQPLSHAASPMSFPTKPLPPQHGPFGIPPMGAAMSFPPGLPQIPPGFGNAIHRDPLFPPMPGFRPAPGMMPMPPGFGGPGGNRGFPMHPPPGFHGPMESPVPSMAQVMTPGLQKDSPSPHSRQGSGSFDAGASQPISRPTPIGRPASVVQGQRPSSGSPSGGLPRPEPEAHLGSRALLDDLDDGPPDFPGRLSRGGSAPGPRPAPGFPMAPFGMDPMFSHNPWGPPGAVQPNLFGPLPPPGFGHSPLSVHAPMSMPWGHPMPAASTFGGPGVVDRPIEPRSVAVRKMLRRACEELANSARRNTEGNGEASNPFTSLERIKTQVEMFGLAVDEKELLDICETEGNEVNGGGSFDVRDDDQGGKSIRFVSGNERPTPQPVQLAVGYHPGSPVGGSR
ncbi:salt tolerance down-regulator-domain-containing protein [Parachaetomium inaequale]|uniref:Stress response protein NST1 n=1 Tax=Parachaetomium inaequale TaxID=2588326 RepID=A0AAN6PKN6_9PEZI|nr:salt tolerance down-regulator-domain-containing protein [Parachaetomium inaequale]